MSELRDRAAAVGVEIHELRRRAALANDVRTLVPLKEADRALKREFGRGEDVPGDSYSDLKARLLEEAYQEDLATEQVVQRRIETLTAKVRRTVEAELADDRAELEAVAAALDDRQQAVAEREHRASPPTEHSA